MNFKFTIDDFFNDFGAGFIFIIGFVFTNFDKFILLIQDYVDPIQNFNASVVIFLFIFIYIIGLAVSAISNFIDQDLYLLIDKTIRKTIKIKAINKPLYFLKLATFYLFFRRWSVTETIIRLGKKFEKLEKKRKEEIILSGEKSKVEAIPPGLKFILNKTPEDIFEIEKKLRRDVGQFDRHYYFKTQFWQTFSNAILFVYLFNIFVLTSTNFFSLNTGIYFVIFFAGKIMSPMYTKMYLRQMSREIATQNIVTLKKI
jgi:hypothetical protein